jgi:hypothetical protein
MIFPGQLRQKNIWKFTQQLSAVRSKDSKNDFTPI